MKFTISKDDFLAALQQEQHVGSPRTTLPILSNVLLKAGKSGLELTTTDLDVGGSGTTAAHAAEVGPTPRPPRRLAPITRDLPADEVDVSVDEKTLAHIRSGPIYFKVT